MLDEASIVLHDVPEPLKRAVGALREMAEHLGWTVTPDTAAGWIGILMAFFDPDCIVSVSNLREMREPPGRAQLRNAATAVLWTKRAMMPEHSDDIVDDVLNAILPMLGRDG